MHNLYLIGERTILNSQICEVCWTRRLFLTIQDRDIGIYGEWRWSGGVELILISGSEGFISTVCFYSPIQKASGYEETGWAPRS